MKQLASEYLHFGADDYILFGSHVIYSSQSWICRPLDFKNDGGSVVPVLLPLDRQAQFTLFCLIVVVAVASCWAAEVKRSEISSSFHSSDFCRLCAAFLTEQRSSCSSDPRSTLRLFGQGGPMSAAQIQVFDCRLRITIHQPFICATMACAGSISYGP